MPKNEREKSVAGLDEALLDFEDVEDISSFESQVAEKSVAKPGLAGVLFRVVRRKRFILAMVLLALAVLAVVLKRAGFLSPEGVFAFLHDYPVMAPLLYVLLYAVMVIVLIPTLPMNIGAGFLWGPYWGCALTIAGAGLGASVSFAIARYLAADYINAKFRSRAWIWLRAQLERQGWKVVAFTRVNPIFPFGPVNYFFGLTTVPFNSYLLSTLVFISPPAFLFAFLGHSVGGFVLKGTASDFVQNLLVASAALTLLFFLRLAFKKGMKIK